MVSLPLPDCLDIGPTHAPDPTLGTERNTAAGYVRITLPIGDVADLQIIRLRISFCVSHTKQRIRPLSSNVWAEKDFSLDPLPAKCLAAQRGLRAGETDGRTSPAPRKNPQEVFLRGHSPTVSIQTAGDSCSLSQSCPLLERIPVTCSLNLPCWDWSLHRIKDWFGLEGVFKRLSSPPFCNERKDISSWIQPTRDRQNRFSLSSSSSSQQLFAYLKPAALQPGRQLPY